MLRSPTDSKRQPGEQGSDAPEVSVIVPARNEEDCLGACLQSIVTQDAVDFEVIVVDDDSTDRTREIASSFANVQVVHAAPLRPGRTGKSNALATGATHARGTGLLFTDADTVHLPGSLGRTVLEAQAHHAALLSYSPAQEVHGFWEKAIMPVVFAELTATFRTEDVNDPASPVAAANGQYLFIRRDVYESIGGFASLSQSLLEDVDLARAVKRAGYPVYFRFGGDAVRTRMYRNFADLRQGWTKNLALLFPSPGQLAIKRALEFLVVLVGTTTALIAALKNAPGLAVSAGALAATLYALFLRRIRRAHFGWDANLLAIFGLPVFVLLLRRSQLSHRRGAIVWKGRTYGGRAFPAQKPGDMRAEAVGAHRSGT
ncbi:MAG TPA: glycosyltransferase [Terriglobales bacterium]|nr:glycosyltransferase [Terriglobales bacterium]